MKSRRAPEQGGNLKPVKKIELSERHVKLRIVLVVLFIVIALAAFAMGIVFWLSTDAGWTQVEANASDENCSGDFVFYYEVSTGGLDGTEELNGVASAYGRATVNAYRIFNDIEEFDGVNNLAYLNANINTEVEVDEHLYSALQLMQSSGSNLLYYAPVYSYYNSLFFANSDTDAAFYDPYKNEDAAAYVAAVAKYINDGDVSLELLGNNRVILHVSDEYAQFAEENEITSYLDFFVLKNAFIIDYIAEYLQQAGVASGLLTSYDGYTSAFGDGVSSTASIFNKEGDSVYIAGSVTAEGAVSAVQFRDYALNSSDYGCKYGYSDGTTAHRYIDDKDGLYKSSISDLLVYSTDAGCAELMLRVLPLYAADEFDEEGLLALKSDGIYSVYCVGTEIVYNYSGLDITAYTYDGRAYTKRYEE